MKLVIYMVSMITLSMAAYAEPPPGSGDGRFSGWYRELQSPKTGGSCCSIADCRPVVYRSGATLEAFIDSKSFGVNAPNTWVIIPADIIIHGTNPTGEGVACYTPLNGILCFIKASEG